MRRLHSRERFRRLLAVGILLTTAILAAGIADCDGAHTYQLTISSTGPGSVTSPGEGSFTYQPGTVVQLVATPDHGYDFLGWTGNTGDIANRYSASTTIAMNANYSVVATFGDIAKPGPIRP